MPSHDLPGIVAVELTGDNEVAIYRRDGDRVDVTSMPFSPWLVVPETAQASVRKASSTANLAGDGYFSVLARFETWSRWRDSYRALREDPQAAVLAFHSPAEQFLIDSGLSLFDGMEFDQLKRAQLDIETLTLNPGEQEAAVIIITLSMNGADSHIIRADELPEDEMIDALAAWIDVHDPDVIEGHNLFNFDIPYLAERARRCNRTLNWGRDGSAVRFGSSRRFKAGARSVPFEPAYVHGRHFIDTYQQIQRYDYVGLLSSYGLKQAVEGLGLSRPDRTFVPGEQIANVWRSDPGMLVAYAVDDVLDTDLLSRLALPTEFYQTRLLPSTLQQVAIGGPGEKVNDLLVRAYLACEESIPAPQAPRNFPGGYTELRRVGRFSPVVKCDVESLYPAIMLTDRISPASDHLGVFLPLLDSLTQERLSAKRQASVSTGYDRARWDGLQSSLKVLINSFYGYLGYSRGYFNDFGAAEQVTVRGHQIIQQVTEELETRGARTIEIDTDGVYFEPPEKSSALATEIRLIEAVSEGLPGGISLAHDGRWQGMLSLRLKNYVLLGYDDRLVLKGSGLRSRRDEPYLRRFIQDASRGFLAPAAESSVRDLFLATAERILNGKLGPEDIARTETISETTFRSDSTRRLAEALGSERIGERVAVYQKDNGELARIHSYAGDEDRQYLLRRLRDVAQRFRPLYATSDAFDYDFPAVTLRTNLEEVREAKQVNQMRLF
ncbi:DNA polymerase domain-containing protein [soil metagenome]